MSTDVVKHPTRQDACPNKMSFPLVPSEAGTKRRHVRVVQVSGIASARFCFWCCFAFLTVRRHQHDIGDSLKLGGIRLQSTDSRQ